MSALIEENDATSQAVPCLHHDKSATLSCSVHGDHRQPDATSLGDKNKIVEGYTSRYNLTRLVYYECFFYPDAAINREKEIKGWRRSKKIKLIESMNPNLG